MGPSPSSTRTCRSSLWAPTDELFDKTASNLEEAAARGGRVILIADQGRHRAPRAKAAHVIEVPAAVLRRSHHLRGAGAAPRLPRRRGKGTTVESAAQSGEECYGE